MKQFPTDEKTTLRIVPETIMRQWQKHDEVQASSFLAYFSDPIPGMFVVVIRGQRDQQTMSFVTQAYNM